MKNLKSTVTKMIEELKSSMVIGWGVLELTESVQEGKTRKN